MIRAYAVWGNLPGKESTLGIRGSSAESVFFSLLLAEASGCRPRLWWDVIPTFHFARQGIDHRLWSSTLNGCKSLVNRWNNNILRRLVRLVRLEVLSYRNREGCGENGGKNRRCLGNKRSSVPIKRYDYAKRWGTWGIYSFPMRIIGPSRAPRSFDVEARSEGTRYT